MPRSHGNSEPFVTFLVISAFSIYVLFCSHKYLKSSRNNRITNKLLHTGMHGQTKSLENTKSPQIWKNTNRQISKTKKNLSFLSKTVRNNFTGNTNIKTLSKDSKRHKMLMISAQYSRMGNLLFQFAAVFGVSRTTGHQPVLSHHFKQLLNLFPNISCDITNNSALMHLKLLERPHVIHESRFAAYFGDSQLERIPNNKDVIIQGYFQSWKYFQKYERELREQLTISRYHRNTVQAFLWSIKQCAVAMASDINSNISTNSKPEMHLSGNPCNLSKISSIQTKMNSSAMEMTFIGLHIRKGDMASSRERLHGYNTASTQYIEKAVKYFTQKYHNTHFIIVTDDDKWVLENIKMSPFIHFFHSRGKSNDFLDLALLSECNHTVLTTGTFGWWGGWLAGGEVLYYDKPYNPSTTLYKGFQPNDHFLPQWKTIHDV